MHADRFGEVWVFQPSYTPILAGYSGHVVVHKFVPATGLHSVYSFAAHGSTKHTTIYDPNVDAFYYLGQIGDFVVIWGATGGVTRRAQMFTSSAESGMGYPHMALDGTRLYVGGTVAGVAPPIYYRDILLGYSDDTGLTVRDLSGVHRAFPIEFRRGGGLTSLVPDHWYNQNSWLQSIAPIPGRPGVMGMYAMAGTHVTVGVATPPAANAGSVTNWIASVSDANGLMYSGDGILVRDGDELYAISGGTVPGASGRCILVMRWTGSGWETVGRTEPLIGFNSYAISGMRKRVPGQPIVITLTDQRSPDRWNQRVLVLTIDP